MRLLIALTLFCGVSLFAINPFPSSAHQYPVDVFPNGCAIAAVEFQANLSLRRHGIWSRVVRISFNDSASSHAVVIFSPKNGIVYIYDVMSGSSHLGTDQRDIRSINLALRYRYPRMTTAVFWD